jgi:hypothetical protein
LSRTADGGAGAGADAGDGKCGEGATMDLQAISYVFTKLPKYLLQVQGTDICPASQVTVQHVDQSSRLVIMTFQIADWVDQTLALIRFSVASSSVVELTWSRDSILCMYPTSGLILSQDRLERQE